MLTDCRPYAHYVRCENSNVIQLIGRTLISGFYVRLWNLHAILESVCFLIVTIPFSPAATSFLPSSQHIFYGPPTSERLNTQSGMDISRLNHELAEIKIPRRSHLLSIQQPLSIYLKHEKRVVEKLRHHLKPHIKSLGYVDPGTRLARSGQHWAFCDVLDVHDQSGIYYGHGSPPRNYCARGCQSLTKIRRFNSRLHRTQGPLSRVLRPITPKAVCNNNP